MAGSPIRRQQTAELKARWEELCEEIEAGASDAQALRSLGFSFGVAIMRRVEKEDSALADQLARARKAGAASMMSETIDIADEVAEFAVLADPVRTAQLRINVRQQLASKVDRERYGDSKGVQVNVNVNALHLTAIKSDAEPLPVIEAEVREVEQPALPQLSLDDLL